MKFIVAAILGICIGYYTPASAISVIHVPEPEGHRPEGMVHVYWILHERGCNMVFISYGSHTAHAL